MIVNRDCLVVGSVSSFHHKSVGAICMCVLVGMLVHACVYVCTCVYACECQMHVCTCACV